MKAIELTATVRVRVCIGCEDRYDWTLSTLFVCVNKYRRMMEMKKRQWHRHPKHTNKTKTEKIDDEWKKMVHFHFTAPSIIIYLFIIIIRRSILVPLRSTVVCFTCCFAFIFLFVMWLFFDIVVVVVVVAAAAVAIVDVYFRHTLRMQSCSISVFIYFPLASAFIWFVCTLVECIVWVSECVPLGPWPVVSQSVRSMDRVRGKQMQSWSQLNGRTKWQASGCCRCRRRTISIKY